MAPFASLRAIALIAAVAAVATVAGAWAFQITGYAPCELCLKERIPYYVGAPLALAAFALAARNAPLPGRLCLGVAALVFALGAGLGVYHSGVEFGWWAGPTDCTGDFAAATSTQDFLKQLNNVQVVRCDAVALRVLGLSLAVWNAVISVGLAVLALFGALKAR